MTDRLRRFLAHPFRNDARGNVSILATLAFVPFAMAATAAVDLANAVRIKTNLQAAVDAGALAGATALATGRKSTDKKRIAEDAFFANIPPEVMAAFPTAPETEINFPDRKVYMRAKVNTDKLMTKLIVDSMNISADATAQVDPGNPICLLALNKTAWKSLHVQGTADLEANGCSVHVNSNHAEGMLQTGSGTAIAESFCVNGGYSGSNYTPKPKPGCMQEEDPLAEKFATAIEGVDLTTCKTGVPTTINSDTALTPGVYCGGLTIKKGTVTLAPGTYVFRDGEFEVQAQATVVGVGVTILLAGNSSTSLTVRAGGDLQVTAPATGPFAGIVIAQHPDSVPAKENLIIGGGNLAMEGIIYFPKQPLKITGGGEVGSETAQFAIIADTIALEGNGLLTIHISSDYEAAGLPKLPEAQEVVRLAD